MENILHLYDDARKQLGRQLREEEVNFLQWMYNRYSEEQQSGCVKNSKEAYSKA
ncbi:hypothetical protein [Oceanobacillus salinisoli]|uniref:hypothetical protein n=1 Tax=Oceanobacillus salinisoli TaxID=2678611 RepID=UPI0012E24B58|nr:hypothetical protein [Oceanobacillus salinisoli]